METSQEKRYCCYHVEWSDEYEFYIATDDVMWNGKVLEFDHYSEFLEFMGSLTEEQKQGLDIWRLEDTHTNEFVTISDGIF